MVGWSIYVHLIARDRNGCVVVVVVFFFFAGGGGGGVFSQNEGCFKEFAVENKMDMVDGLRDSDNHK